VNRRKAITLLGRAAAAWPLAARAQQTDRMRRIGVLVVSDLEPLGPFREALAVFGYVECKNIQIDVRSAQAAELAGKHKTAARNKVRTRAGLNRPQYRGRKYFVYQDEIIIVDDDMRIVAVLTV
jgi:hypothetical protein